MVRRAAFTLIELVFAIVVIAIAVVSLPMMNQAISKGIDSNIVQEAIFAAATELNEVTTAHWDENSLEPGEPNSLARVIETGFCENNALLATYREMPGHINQQLHRRCLDSNVTSPSNVNVAGVTSLSDSIKTNVAIFINNIANQQSGYKTNYTADVGIVRPSIFGGTLNPDIKQVTITIKDGATPITSLKTYSANIGEVDYYKKEY